MSDVAVRLDRVSKKFTKGEIFDSLRDLLPALGRSLWKKPSTELAAREFWALKDISFEIPRGEAFAVVGSNGAGKSTMLKLLSRIMRPTEGHLSVKGRLSALIEVSAGFHPDLTGRENIYLNGAILGMKKQEITARLDEIVAFSGLEQFLDTPVKRYSSGMHARLGFAIAAHVNPEVLIVDEVLSVGDYAFQQRCIQRMRDVINSGATVLFVSHNLKAVTELCSRAILLEHGRNIMVGPSEELVRTYMQRLADSRSVPTDKAAYISNVRLRNQRSEAVRFDSGELAWMDIEVTALRDVEKLSVAVYMMDESHHSIFNTSTERLGLPSFSLREGDKYSCTFQLRMNCANGTFYPSAALYRYDIQKEYDCVSPAATVYVTAAAGVRGAVNCFPEVCHQEIVRASALAQPA